MKVEFIDSQLLETKDPIFQISAPDSLRRTRGAVQLAALLILLLLGVSKTAADNIVWDGSAGDGFWTNGAQTDPNSDFPDNDPNQGANWTIGAGPAGQLLDPNAFTTGSMGLPSGNQIDYAFNGHNFSITGATISEDVQIKLDGGSLDILNSSVSLVPSSANTGANLSGLNLGQDGAATTATLTNSTLTTSRSNSNGNSLRIRNGSSLAVVNSIINVSSELGSGNFVVENSGSTLTVDPNSTLNVTGGFEVTNNLANVAFDGAVLNAGWLRLNSGNEATQELMFDFLGGTITLSDSNPLRDNSSFEGAFDWIGGAGSGTITHTDLSSNDQNLAGKITQGYFSIDGTRINPTIVNTLDWSDSANIDALNAELAALVVGGKVLTLSVDDPNAPTTQTLSLVSIPVVSWNIDADGVFGVANNWDPNMVPTASDTALFGAGTISAPRTVTLDAAYTVGGVTLAGSQAYTIAGTGSNTLTTTEVSVSGTHEIAAPLAGASGLTVSGVGTLQLTGNNSGLSGGITVDTGNLEVTDPNNLGGNAVTINSGGELHISGDGLGGSGFAGTFSETVTGDGELNFTDSLTTEVITLGSGLSGHNGAMAIDGGVVVANDASDFGGSGATWINQAQGQLQISTGLTTGENFNIGSRADGSDAHLAVTGGNPTLSGNVNGTNGDAQHIIEVASGSTLTINGTVGTPALVTDDNDNGTFVFQGDGDVTIGNAGTPGSGKLTGTDPNSLALSVNVIKRGSGNLTIATATTNTADYYAGTTTIEGGTLTVLSNGSNGGEITSSSIQVRSGATFDVDDFGDYSLQIGQGLGGAGTVVAQTLSVFDDSVITPGDSVGTLTVTGNVTMDSFSGSPDPNTAMTFELGSSTTVGGGVNDLLDISGSLTINTSSGTNSFNVDILPVAGSLATGTYRLVDAAGGGSAPGATSSNFDVRLADSQGNTYGSTRQSLSVDPSTGGQLNLIVTGTSQSKTWIGSDGSNPTFWDINSTNNWSAGGGDNRYFDLDQVTFDNSASSFAVEIREDVRPGSVTFNNSAGNDYTIGGADPNGTGTAAFGIAGLTGIVKNNTGTVTLSSTNSFTGGIAVNAGTLILNGRNADAGGDLTVASGATLQLGDGTGANFDSFPNNTTSITIDGELVQNETGGEGISSAISGTGSMRVESGNLTLSSADNTFSGGAVINGGSLLVNNGGNVGTGTITINSGGQFRANGESHTVSNAITLNGGTIAVGGAGASAFTLDGNVTVSGTGSTIRSDGGTGADGLTMAGIISGAADLQVNSGGNATVNFTSSVGTTGTVTKTGSGTMALSGGTGTISSPTIDVAAGDLDVTAAAGGGLALSGQTLSGEATVTGNVSTAASSLIRVGDQGLAGTDRLIGYWTFDTDGSDSSSNNNPATFGTSASVDLGSSVAGAGSLGLTDPNDDNGNRAEITDFAGVTGNGGRTYSFWLNAPDPNSQENNATFIGAGTNSTGQRFDVKLNGGDELRVEIQGNGLNYPATDGGGFFDGTWHHVAVTLPDGGTLDDVKLYLDGVLQADDGTSSGEAVNTSDTNLYFGDSHNTTANRNFAGNLDDIQLYDLELDPNQITFLVNNPGSTVSGLGQLFEAVDFEITGDLTLDASSTLEIDLADPNAFDSLIVGGALSASGTLDVNKNGAYTLSSGDVFDILDFDPNTISGSFTLDLPTLGSGLLWDTSSLLTTGEISVVSSGLPGDFNGDGRVDGQDFLEWQRNPGIGSLSDWEANYGLPTTSTTTSVPEPSSLLLVLFGAGLGLGRFRKT